MTSLPAKPAVSVGTLAVRSPVGARTTWVTPLCEAGPAGVARRAAGYLTGHTRFEVSVGLDAWCCQASRALKRGDLLVIDNGDVEPDIWLANPRGTLTTCGPSDLGSSPLEDPGRKDIAFRVNFSALERLPSPEVGSCRQASRAPASALDGIPHHSSRGGIPQPPEGSPAAGTRGPWMQRTASPG